MKPTFDIDSNKNNTSKRGQEIFIKKTTEFDTKTQKKSRLSLKKKMSVSCSRCRESFVTVEGLIAHKKVCNYADKHDNTSDGVKRGAVDYVNKPMMQQDMEVNPVEKEVVNGGAKLLTSTKLISILKNQNNKNQNPKKVVFS